MMPAYGVYIIAFAKLPNMMCCTSCCALASTGAVLCLFKKLLVCCFRVGV